MDIETKSDTLHNVTSSKSPLRIELSKKLFEELTEVLNEVHGTDYSLRFWKLMTAKHVNAVITRKMVLERKEYFRTPTLESINGLTFPSRKQIVKQSIKRLAKYLMMCSNRNRYFSVLKNNSNILLGFPDSDGLNKEGLGAKLPKYDKHYIGGGDRVKRKRVNRIAKRYSDNYLSNVVRELPKILVEHFQKTYESIKLCSPENKIIHVHLTETIYNDFLVAKYVEHGAKLYWYQHGSEYGEFQYDHAHHYSHDVSEQFRTWGWKIKEKDVPWKAYRLESFKESYQSFDTTEQYKLLLCYPQINSKNRRVYEYFTDKLLTSLDKVKYDDIIARPRRSNKIHSHASDLNFIKYNEKRVKITTGLKPMMKEMKMCDIVLQINVPSTNFLECLYVDHPTIGILNNDQPTDIVKPYYEFFQEMGVLHKDIESLVAHLNQIEIKKWWSRLIKEEKYQSYKELFARKVV